MKLSWKFFLVFYLLSISSRWHESVAYGALFIPVTTGSLLGASFVMPTIFWDPRNPIFNCPNKGVNTINIRMNDYFRLACPKPGRFIDWHESPNVVHDDMYGNAFLTDNKTAADHCTAGSLTSILDCNDPLKSNKYRTIRIAQHSGIDTDPLFKYNTAYYIFSTATGSSSGINNRVGGRCNSSKPNEYKMILKLNVCGNGEAGTDKCPICLTASCYNYGCGTYSDWKKTNKYQRLNNNCSIVYQRTCDYSGGSCYGPPNKVEQTDVSKCSESSKTPKCNLTNTNFNRNSSNTVVTKVCCQIKGGANCCNDTGGFNVTCCGGCITANKRSEQSDMVRLSVGIFIFVILLTLATGLVVGIFSGTQYAKKRVRPSQLAACCKSCGQ